MLKSFSKIAYPFLLLSAFIWLVPLADASVLYFAPESSRHNLGDTFILEARINTEGEFINAADVEIRFLEDVFQVSDFSNGNSILSLWLENPSANKGVISFAGGIPAGYQGSDGLLAKIIFVVKPSAKQDGESLNESFLYAIEFNESSKILLNDGTGTPADIKLKSANIAIAPKLAAKSADAWQDEIILDSTSPEPFTVIISNDKSVFGGKHFISFLTVDKQTGVDHYEVFEYYNGKVSESKNASSPYILDNQELNGIIRVQAVDKRGNEAISEIKLNRDFKTGQSHNYLGIVLFSLPAALMGFASAMIFYAKRRRKSQKI